MNELPELFPHIEAWVRSLQRKAVTFGQRSPPLYRPFAEAAEVRNPERIYILAVEAIPRPDHQRIAELAEQIGLLTDATGAITAGYGILVRSDCIGDLKLIVHEIVHVEQYERLGVSDFLLQYIQQLNEYGYKKAPLEIEAEAKSNKILAYRSAEKTK
jgi:hypothetical protein